MKGLTYIEEGVSKEHRTIQNEKTVCKSHSIFEVILTVHRR